MQSPADTFPSAQTRFNPGCEPGQCPTERDAVSEPEPFEALREPDPDDPSLAESIAEASMVRFLFLQGQPGPRGFLLKGTSVGEVFVAGDFNGWNPTALPMEQYDDGYWEADIPLQPGQHEYLFVADGAWRPDPMAESVPNPFGGVNSVMNVPARP